MNTVTLPMVLELSAETFMVTFATVTTYLSLCRNTDTHMSVPLLEGSSPLRYKVLQTISFEFAMTNSADTG